MWYLLLCAILSLPACSDNFSKKDVCISHSMIFLTPKSLSLSDVAVLRFIKSLIAGSDLLPLNEKSLKYYCLLRTVKLTNDK